MLSRLERERNPSVLSEVVGWLGGYGAPDIKIIDALLALLQETPHEDVRRATVRTLSVRGTSDAVQPIRSLLESEHLLTRAAAAVALCRLDDAESLPVIERVSDEVVGYVAQYKDDGSSEYATLVDLANGLPRSVADLKNGRGGR